MSKKEAIGFVSFFMVGLIEIGFVPTRGRDFASLNFGFVFRKFETNLFADDTDFVQNWHELGLFFWGFI